jgi:hypothetical protein
MPRAATTSQLRLGMRLVSSVDAAQHLTTTDGVCRVAFTLSESRCLDALGRAKVYNRHVQLSRTLSPCHCSQGAPKHIRPRKRPTGAKSAREAKSSNGDPRCGAKVEVVIWNAAP